MRGSRRSPNPLHGAVALYVSPDRVISSRAGGWEAGLIVAEHDPPRLGVHRMLEEQQVAAVVAVTGRRACKGCGDRLPALARSDARYCSVWCRVGAWRAGVA